MSDQPRDESVQPRQESYPGGEARTQPVSMSGGMDATTTQIPAIGGVAENAPEGPGRLSAADQATIEALRPGTALLIALRGPNTGARFLLDADEVSTGRHPDSDIFLDDVTVSRRHLVFRRGPAGYEVQDVGSLNGTYVNMQLVDSAPLHTGDEVTVGKFRLVYYASPATA